MFSLTIILDFILDIYMINLYFVVFELSTVMKRKHLFRPILGSMIIVIVKSFMIWILCFGEVAIIQANHHLDFILEFYTFGFLLSFLHQAML